MGKYPRPRQERLANKLLKIREALGLSQNEMLRHLGLEEKLFRTDISNFELDHRQLHLYVLLEYARAAGVCLDALVDDELDLPEKLPSTPKHHGVKPVATKRGKGKH